jgi:hypothetical protein
LMLMMMSLLDWVVKDHGPSGTGVF